jgi:hypothetical protein
MIAKVAADVECLIMPNGEEPVCMALLSSREIARCRRPSGRGRGFSGPTIPKLPGIPERTHY